MSGRYRISDELRSVIRFRKANLFEPYTVTGSFDIFLCRNIAIYFSKTDRVKLFDALVRRLKRHAGY
jgi:chemotaxis protein methyltransferase CheR